MVSKAERLLKLAQTKVKDPSAIIDCFDFSVVLMSKECAETLGYSQKDLIGKQVYQLGSMSEHYIRNMLLKMVQEGVANKIKGKTKQGKLKRLHVDFFPLQDRHNLYLIVKFTVN